MNDIRDEWRIRDVEQKAERAFNRLYELDALRSDVASLERSIGELCTCIDGIRAAVESCLSRIEALENAAIGDSHD
jgi:hypothetical protein